MSRTIAVWLIAPCNMLMAFGLLKLGQHEHRQIIQLALRLQAVSHPGRTTLFEAPGYDPPATLAGYALNAPASSLMYFLGDLYKPLYAKYYPTLVPLNGYITLWGVNLYYLGDLLYLVLVFLLWFAIGTWATRARSSKKVEFGKIAYILLALGLGSLTVTTACRGWSVYTELPFSIAWSRHPLFCLAISAWILWLAWLTGIASLRARRTQMYVPNRLQLRF